MVSDKFVLFSKDIHTVGTGHHQQRDLSKYQCTLYTGNDTGTKVKCIHALREILVPVTHAASEK
jgi:hypothetical protein